jgi:hypothetical protein
MNCISPIQILLFPNDGVRKTVERLASRRLSWLGAMVPMTVWGKSACLDNQSTKGRLAMMELKMLLAAIILQFDVEWADKCKDPMADIWSQIDPMHLTLRRRVIPT